MKGFALGNGYLLRDKGEIRSVLASLVMIWYNVMVEKKSIATQGYCYVAKIAYVCCMERIIKFLSYVNPIKHTLGIIMLIAVFIGLVLGVIIF